MYNLLKDSLFTPKNLLQYRNKSGWFTFFYLLFLSIIVAIYSFVFVFSYQTNDIITSASTSCEFQPSGLVCADSVTEGLNLYDLRFYFLNENDAFPAVLTDQSVIFQGKEIFVLLDGDVLFTSSLYVGTEFLSFDYVTSTFQTTIAVMTIIGAIIGSMFLLLFMSVISTLPFLRLRQFIAFKKILKLVIFAVTPLAFLLAFYNLLRLPEWSFILLMLLGYRSLMLLQRELYYQTYLRINAKTTAGTPDGDPEAPTESEEEDDTPDSPDDTEEQPQDDQD